MVDVLSKYLQAGQTTVSNLLLHHYHDLGMSTSELMVYLELKSYLDMGQLPNIKQIATHLGTETSQVYELIHELVSHHFLAQRLQKNAAGQEAEVYDFSPLHARLLQYLEQPNHFNATPEQSAPQDAKERLFKQLESGFGRLLSPMEINLVNDWLTKDHYEPAIIELALRETVLNGKFSFRYMDRILMNWRHRKLTTVAAIEADLRRFAEQKAAPSAAESSAPTPHIPIFKLADQPREPKA
ncbi:DnaD domain-containing protein [Limosilactobacillus ingluviei]|uniref:DnaD domain-containing protein n=1 Tax=Limosilactobacillus ingluviei TaxID=148604 RepID=UPI0023F21FCF|nr:DnaD domain protein [Limosilactobacillus ingluviei]